jgi:serine protease Do
MRRMSGFGLLGCLALMTPVFLASPAAAEDERELRKLLVAGDEEGYLGVRLGEVDAQIAGRLQLGEERGAVVLKVEKGGAAEKAGLELDDVIVRYQGEPVESAVQLARRVRETPPGRKISLEVVRKGAVQKLAATLAKRRGTVLGSEHFDFEVPDLDVEAPHFQMHPGMPPMPQMPDMGNWAWAGPHFGGPRKLGIEFQPISGQLAKYFKLEADQGVLVTSVDDDAPAARAGLKAGDVLLKLDGQDIRSGADLRNALADVEPGQEVAVSALRDGKPIELKVIAGGAHPTSPDKPAKNKRTDDVSPDSKKDVKKPKSI